MESGKIFETLVHLAISKGITVRFAPLPVSHARIKNNRIALNQDLETIEDYNYNLAHELTHYFLHCDKGDITEGENLAAYEEQADRGARMLLEALSTHKAEPVKI